MTNRIAAARKAVAPDWLREELGYTHRPARTPALPFIGLMICGLVGLLLWTALSVSAWALLLP